MILPSLAAVDVSVSMNALLTGPLVIYSNLWPIRLLEYDPDDFPQLKKYRVRIIE